jgi:hypothetical protein
VIRQSSRLALHSFHPRCSVIYFKSALIGFATVVFGCVITLIVLVIWASRKTDIGDVSIGFSPIDAAHSVGFWAFIILLFAVGFISSLLLLKK